MRHLLPVLLVVFSSLGIALAGAVGVLLLTLGPCGMSTGAVTTWLVYQVDVERLPAGADVSPGRVVKVLDRRLNANWLNRKAQVNVGEGDMIEIGLIGVNERDVDEASAHRIGATGVVEFRLLAHAAASNPRDPNDLVTRARATQRDVVHDSSGRAIGRWIDVTAEAGVWNEIGSDVVQRTVPRGSEQIVQILTVEGDTAPGNDVIESAVAGADGQGEPSVRVKFTEKGAARMEGWTGNYAPSLPGQFTQLGVILDGKLLSALPLHTGIPTAVEITGRFSKADAQQLAEMIDAGPLPAPLKYVGRKKTPTK